MRTLVVIVSLLVLVSSALAQKPRAVDEAGPLGIPFMTRDLTAAVAALGFDADQKAAAKALFDGYRASFLEETAKANAAIDAMRKQDADGRIQRGERGAAATKYVEQVAALEKRLLEDLRSLCNAEQTAKFDSVERGLRRRHGFRLALAAGEGVDILDVLKEIKVEPESVAGLPEALLRWEEEVDRLMVEKEQFMRREFGKMIDSAAVQSEEEAAKARKARQDFIGELMRISGRVRDANQKTAREVESLLAEGPVEAFRHRVLVRTLPRIYGPSRAEKYIDECLRLGDVSAEQKSALEELRGAYAREAGPINARFAAAALDMQKRMAEDMEGMMMSQEDPKQEFWALQKERRGLDERTMEKAKAVLSKEQGDRVKRPDDDHMPEFLPDIRELEKGFEEEFGGGEEEPAAQVVPPPKDSR